MPTESRSFSSEKSYSPSRLICSHEMTEWLATAARIAALSSSMADWLRRFHRAGTGCRAVTALHWSWPEQSVWRWPVRAVASPARRLPSDGTMSEFRSAWTPTNPPHARRSALVRHETWPWSPTLFQATARCHHRRGETLPVPEFAVGAAAGCVRHTLFDRTRTRRFPTVRRHRQCRDHENRQSGKNALPL